MEPIKTRPSITVTIAAIKNHINFIQEYINDNNIAQLSRLIKVIKDIDDNCQIFKTKNSEKLHSALESIAKNIFLYQEKVFLKMEDNNNRIDTTLLEKLVFELNEFVSELENDKFSSSTWVFVIISALVFGYIVFEVYMNKKIQ